MNPTSSILSHDERRARNLQTVRTYYRLQEAQDVDTWLSLGRRPRGHPVRARRPKLRVVKGRADLERVYRELFNRYTELRILDLRVDTLRDPDRLLARWHTHAELVGGGTYENHLIGLFEFDPPGQDPQLHGVLQPAACGVVAPAAAN